MAKSLITGSRKRAGIIVGAVLTSALALSACTGGNPGTSPTDTGDATGGSITVITNARAWTGLDPAASAVSTYRVLLWSIYDPLFRLDKDGNVQPWLIKKADRSSDGLTWTFHVQEGVKFQDGTPFDAAAVKFNLDRQIDLTHPSGEGGNLPRKIMKVSVVDPMTVQISLQTPVESLTAALASSVVGLMASPTAVQKFGDKYGLNPVGTGPFILDTSTQIVGQTATVKRNPDYWVKGLPKLDSITFRVADSAASGMQSLRSGEAQFLDNAGPQQVSETKNDPAYTDVAGPTTTISQLYMNMKKPPFNDIRARQAVIYALNQVDIINNLYFGVGQPATSPIGAGSWAYPGTISNYPSQPDLDKAKALVQQLGGLTFTGMFSNTTEGQELGAAIQGQLAKAGIKMSVSTPDQATRISDTFSGKFEATQFAVMGSAEPDVLFRPWFDPTGSNPSGVNDPQLHDLLMKAQTTPGNDARKALYDQAAQRLAEIMPSAFISQVPLYRVLSSKLKGFWMPPADTPFLSEISLSK